MFEKFVLKAGSPTQALFGTKILSIGDRYFGGGFNLGTARSKIILWRSVSISVIFKLRILPSFLVAILRELSFLSGDV